MSLDEVRGAIAIIFGVSLAACGVLQAMGVAEAPQWLIGLGSSWIGWYFASAQYQTKKAIELKRTLELVKVLLGNC
jgi:hypothetical protein